MTRMEAFNQLAKDNGLIVNVTGNVHRAWFSNKDFLMSINTRREYQYLEIATKVLGGKFMMFQRHQNIGPKIYKKLDKQIKQLIGDYKEAQVNTKLEIMEYDFG